MTESDFDFDFHYLASYLDERAIWIAAEFHPRIRDVFKRLSPEIILEIADPDKTIKYFCQVAASGKQIPIDDDMEICRSPIFIAPPRAQFHGLVLDPNPINLDGSGVLVYLSPELLERPHADIDAIIAVQFADVLLQQDVYVSPDLLASCEKRTATQLAKSWGFDVPPLPCPRLPSPPTDSPNVCIETRDVTELMETASLLWVGSEYDRHLRHVFSRLPEQVRMRLRTLRPIFFAPERSVLACTMQVPDLSEFEWRVYLSPELLAEAESKVHRTIAHELAHVYLEHPAFPDGDARTVGEENEAEADRLATEWGFPDDSRPNASGASDIGT